MRNLKGNGEMKFRKIARTRLVKALAVTLLISSVANTGLTVKAEELPAANGAVTTASGNDIETVSTASGNDIETVTAAGGNDSAAVIRENTEGISIAEAKSEYPAIDTVILAGGRMAKWLGGQSATRWVDTNNYKPANSDFSLLNGHKMTLDDATTFYQLSAFNTGVDKNGAVNGSNGAEWQCVGFVAFDAKRYTNDKPADLLHYVYYSGDSEDTSYYKENCGKSLEDVKQYIGVNNGILYGEAVTNKFMEQLLEAGRVRKEVTIATVWYVTTPIETWTNYNGYDYKIPGVSAVDYYSYSAGRVTFEENAEGAVFHYASEGVTVTTTPALVQYREDGTGRVTYDNATITITIHSGAPDNVKINLSDAIGYLNDTVTGENAAEPGDTLYYTLKLVNESNKDYQYSPKTAMIGTISAKAPKAGEEVTILSHGFEGYEIGETGEFCTLPRRILNAPLRDLGITEGKVTDAVVGAALLKKGYGDENSEPEKITKTYLAQYYLDWFNNTSRKEGNKVYRLADLTAEEFAILTNGTADTTVLESCPAVADALYYTAYHNVYTFDGKGLYDRMLENGRDGSYADTLVTSLLSTGGAKITSQFDGELANNGYQMTRYGFGMQFELYCETTVIPSPTPSTTPKPTPTPAPSTTPSPDTTPAPNTTPAPSTPDTPDRPEPPQVLGARRQRVVSITDDPTPLADKAVLGASRRPKTGDASDAWNLGFALSLTGLGAWLILKKKQ